jgi:hypothetical protein
MSWIASIFMRICGRATSCGLAAALVSLGLACSGCADGTRADIDSAWTLDEHGNPDFKPHDFDEAVAVLKSRFAAVAALPSPETTDAAMQFRQIIRWMPEFAADTPIRRTGWEQLADLCARMESAARAPGFFVADRADAFAKELETIAALAPPDLTYRRLKDDPEHEPGHDSDKTPFGQPEGSPEASKPEIRGTDR